MNWLQKICEEERVVAAAIHVGDKIYLGDDHAEAAVKAFEDIFNVSLSNPLSSSDVDLWDKFSTWIGTFMKQGYDGFYTNTNRFVSRVEAKEIAQKAKQFSPHGQWSEKTPDLDSYDVNMGIIK